MTGGRRCGEYSLKRTGFCVFLLIWTSPSFWTERFSSWMSSFRFFVFRILVFKFSRLSAHVKSDNFVSACSVEGFTWMLVAMFCHAQAISDFGNVCCPFARCECSHLCMKRYDVGVSKLIFLRSGITFLVSSVMICCNGNVCSRKSTNTNNLTGKPKAEI